MADNSAAAQLERQLGRVIAESNDLRARLARADQLLAWVPRDPAGLGLDRWIDEHLGRARDAEDLAAALAVLGAVDDIPEATLASWVERGFETVLPLARAAMARRAAKEAKGG